MKGEQRQDRTGPDTRTLILDATERIMLEEGYAGVTSRKVAEKAGLKSKLLHYYFRTMDDLFRATFERMEDRHDERFAAAAASDTPLRNLWALHTDAAGVKLIFEFTALANHIPAVREFMGRSARRDRSAMAAALDSVFRRYDVDRQAFPPAVVAILMAGLSRALSIERALGAEAGHDEALAFAKRCLDEFEPIRPATKTG